MPLPPPLPPTPVTALQRQEIEEGIQAVWLVPSHLPYTREQIHDLTQLLGIALGEWKFGNRGN